MSERVFWADGEPVQDPWRAARRALRLWYGVERTAPPADVAAFVSRFSELLGWAPEGSLLELARLAGELQGTDTALEVAPCCERVPGADAVALFRHAQEPRLRFGVEREGHEDPSRPAIGSYDSDVSEDDLNPDDPDASVLEPLHEHAALDPAAFAFQVVLNGYVPEGGLALVGTHEGEAEELDALAAPALGAAARVGGLWAWEAPGLVLAQRWTAQLGWWVTLAISSRAGADRIPRDLLEFVGVGTRAVEAHPW